MRKLAIIHGVLPLVVGATLYCLYRPFRLLQDLGIHGISNSGVPLIVYQQLPDFLWAYSLATFVFLMDSKASWPSLLAVIAFCYTFEVSKGTFDVFDLVAYTCAAAISYLMLRRKFLILS